MLRSYWNQLIDLKWKQIDWFLYEYDIVLIRIKSMIADLDYPLPTRCISESCIKI